MLPEGRDADRNGCPVRPIPGRYDGNVRHSANDRRTMTTRYAKILLERAVLVIFSTAAIACALPAPRGHGMSQLTGPVPGRFPQSFDSLNCRLVGNWPFGPSYAVAVDSARNLVFCGSGGGVYVLDVSDSANPVKLSDAIH